MEKYNRQDMNIVIVGHVDHGKSTIIGRLMADTNSLPEGKLEAVKERCKRNSKPFEYAFLLDALKDEQEQGITIDAARCFFKTDKRDYIIIDAPGHIEFLKNMVTGASRAEVALLVIDAHEGIQENSRRHGYLLSMLGIKKVAVVINKMDLVDYSEEVYTNIVKEYSGFLEKININPTGFVPVSGFFGVNIVGKSKETKWYKGPSILEMLDGFTNEQKGDYQAFRMPVQGIYKFTKNGDDRRIVAGSIDSGTLNIGDEVVFYPSLKKSRVKSIEGFNKKEETKVTSGYATGFTLEEQIYVKRGEVVARVGEKEPNFSQQFKGNIFWLGKKALVKNKEYIFKVGTAKVKGSIEEIVKVINASNLDSKIKSQVEKHEVAQVIVKTQKPIAFDLADHLSATSRFVIVDDYEIAGGGIITDNLEDLTKQSRIENKVISTFDVTRVISKKMRAERLSQIPTLILLNAKADNRIVSLGYKLEERLFKQGRQAYFISPNENLTISKASEWSQLILETGQIAIINVEDLYLFKDQLPEYLISDSLTVQFDNNLDYHADIRFTSKEESEGDMISQILGWLRNERRIFSV
ncbi:MAG: GTP-binding protein [Acidaminobacteraceae bacterium]